MAQAETDSASSDPPSARRHNARENARISQLMKELDTPLEDIDWRHTTLSPRESGSGSAFLRRLRRERQHRRELHRAREAANRAFGVKPRLSARKRATLMLSSGAVGLAAFTSPVAPRELPAAGIDLQDGDARLPANRLRASDDFKQALMEEEGVRYTVYRDVAGYPTVGVGHLVRPGDNLRVGDKVDENRVMQFLDDDLAVAEQGVRDLVGDLPLMQNEFDALLDLVYNVGRGNVDSDRSPRLNDAIAARDYEAIAEELQYTRAGGKIARGLEHRSTRRAAIFMEARYENPREGAT